MRPLATLASAALLALTACGTATQDTAPASTGNGEAAEADPAVGASAPTDSSPQDAGRPVPDVLKFRAQTLDGETYDGRDLAGRPAVLWFWAPWCPTCRAQGPGVSALQEQYGDRVGIVGVGGLDRAEAMGDFATAVDDDVPLIADEEGDVWRRFGVTEQSSYVVLDADGSTVASGFLDDGELADLVDKLAS